MPKYYCDYCATFLTHDSKSVRTSHINGWKHKASVKNWYEQFMANESQEVINQRIKAFEARMAAMQAGGLPGALPGGMGKPPMPPPNFAVPPPNFSMPPPGMQGPPGMPPRGMPHPNFSMPPPGMQGPPPGMQGPPHGMQGMPPRPGGPGAFGGPPSRPPQ